MSKIFEVVKIKKDIPLERTIQSGANPLSKNQLYAATIDAEGNASVVFPLAPLHINKDEYEVISKPGMSELEKQIILISHIFDRLNEDA